MSPNTSSEPSPSTDITDRGPIAGQGTGILRVTGCLEDKEATMLKMRAKVFRGVNDIRVEDVERPRAGVGEAVIRITLTTICGTDLHIVRGEYPVQAGPGHRPRAGRRDRGARAGRHRLRDRRPRPGRRDHALRPVPRLPVRAPFPVRPRRRVRGHRRLALRQHHQRRPGRVSARALMPRRTWRRSPTA